MTEKDLMEGLNHIEDSLIEEAAAPVRRRRFLRLPAAAAAVLVLGAGIYAASFGLFRDHKNLPSGEQSVMRESAVGEAAETVEYEADEAEDDVALMPEAAMETAAAGQAGKTGLQSAVKAPENDGGPARAGMADGNEPGGEYHTAGSYEEIYDLLRAEREVQEELLPGDALREEELEMAAEEAVPAAGAAAVTEAGDAEEADMFMQAGGEAAAGFSMINVMTEGTDEGDIIRTDGEYIYSTGGRSVHVTDIREGKPGETVILDMPEEAAMDAVEELYVDGGALVVLGWRLKEQDPSCTQTIAAVFDLTETGEPVYAGCTIQDGSYETSRKAGDTLYLFTRCGISLPALEKKDALTEECLRRWIPGVNGNPVATDCIYVTENADSGMLVSSLRIQDPRETVDAGLLLAGGKEIYVSSGAMYLYDAGDPDGMEHTRILKLTCEDGLISAETAVTVPGRIPDRFAIWEQDGCLRVLTTEGESADAENRLILLDEHLTETGRIEDIAHGGTVCATRPIGNLVYFAAYGNTDLLFAADLSDPADPVLLGRAEGSGFPEYLHPWDETHLLGIGYETDPETGDLRGVRLTMSDISDPVHIREENSFVLQDDLGSSAIDWNYKAVFISPEKNLFGFMTWKQTDGGLEPAYNVFSYDRTEGFVQRLRNTWKGYDELYEECRGLYAGSTFYIADAAHIYAFKMGDDGDDRKLIPQ